MKTRVLLFRFVVEGLEEITDVSSSILMRDPLFLVSRGDRTPDLKAALQQFCNSPMKKGLRLTRNPLYLLVEQRGIEPLTSRLPDGFCFQKTFPYFPILWNYLRKGELMI
ncbi:MAG: hypothetical protein A3K22_04095 [Deltaproteobacteria bacterium RBG_16_42_7]|nr:MAG: hypothetical protein A2052_02030 [Deltaproteobacteria bacterium GWA2_54_12]OGP65721.1 MAG: hypothetical protein A3K22_04095 [Deltaproteobacteria bacterium RBG_16_42_7]